MNLFKKFESEKKYDEMVDGVDLSPHWMEFWTSYDSLLEKAYMRNATLLDEEDRRIVEKLFIKSLLILSEKSIGLHEQLQKKEESICNSCTAQPAKV